MPGIEMIKGPKAGTRRLWLQWRRVGDEVRGHRAK